MKYADIKIGDVVPLEGFRKPFGGSCVPSWFILNTGRQRQDMVAATAWLEVNGATDCWFPEEMVRRNIKRRGQVFRKKVLKPIVPGVVFMLTDRFPSWDVLYARKNIRPMKIGDRPVAISEKVMADMEQVPERITTLKQEMIEAAELARLAKVPKPGQSAEFVAGPFEGRIVTIEAIHGEDAIVLIEGFRIRSSLTSLEKRS